MGDSLNTIANQARHVARASAGTLQAKHCGRYSLHHPNGRRVADVQDRDGAKLLLNVLTFTLGWLKLIWADGGYAGKLIDHVAEIPRHRRVKLEIVKRSDDVKGFKVLPKRWIVERTFGWLIQSRRLVRDYEVKILLDNF